MSSIRFRNKRYVLSLMFPGVLLNLQLRDVYFIFIIDVYRHD